MRTVYLGTSDFAADVLARLADSRHRPALVVTRPDRPRGRGRRVAAPPVADAARALGIALDQPESVNDAAARERIAAAEPDFVCVCAFGALVRKPLLSDHEILNVHPSLLPRWRGAAPIERAIMAGDRETGICIMRLTAGLDSGPVWRAEPTPLAPDDTYGSLSKRLAAIGGELLVAALDAAAGAGPLTYAEQDEAGAAYAEKLTAADRMIDPARPAAELQRVVRALSPHIGAAVILPYGARLKVWAADARDPGPGDPPAGELSLDGALPRLGCSPGTLHLRQVQPPGGRLMPGEDWLRGRRR